MKRPRTLANEDKVGCWLALVTIGISIPATILRGYALSRLWLWFVAPLGVAPIGVAQAIGGSILVGMFTNGLARDRDPDRSERDRSIANLAVSIAMPLLALLFGAIVHSFM